MTNLVQLIKVAGPKMVPFLKSVTIYFLLVTFEHRGKVWSTVLKCAPIVCLMLFAILYGIKFGREYNYAHKILIGLIFSCFGDALLNWNLFEFGMGAFGVAQIFYISAFGFKPLKIWIAIVLYVLGSLTVFIFHSKLSTVLLVGLPIYTLLLLTMAWRAIARVDDFRDFQNFTKLTCAVGGILFVISDTMIAVNLFYTEIPHSQILIMVTYYAAQFGITLSIVNIKLEPTPTDKQSTSTTSTITPSHNSSVVDNNNLTDLRQRIKQLLSFISKYRL